MTDKIFLQDSNFQLMRTYAPGERDIIKRCLDEAWRKKRR